VSTTEKGKTKSTVSKAKGFKKSRPGTYLAIGTSLFSAYSNIKRARTARGESDSLKLVDAVVSAAAIATGLALLVRELRRMNDDDILSS
jgi:predicted nucleic acid-binding protein